MSLENKINKYYQKMIENIDLIVNSMPEDDDHEIIQDSFRIMASPQNEIELDFADAYLSLLIKIHEVAAKTKNGSTRIAPLNKNKFMDQLIKEVQLINEERRNRSYTPFKNLNSSESISLIYDAATFSGYDEEEVVRYLCNSLKIDKHDEGSKFILAEQLEHIQFNILLRPFSNDLEEHMMKTIVFAKLFENYSNEKEIKRNPDEDSFSY